MKNIFSICFTLLLGVSYCAITNDTLQKKEKINRNNERIAVKAAAIKTIKWFFEQKNKLDKGWTGSYLKGEEGDSTNPYRIDFEGVNTYFSYLKKTNLFSQIFFDDLLTYFKRCDSNFIAVKQYEKIPLGFEYNIITKDMDDMGVESNINKSQISSYKKVGNTVYLSLKFTEYATYTFVLTKHNGKWLVDNINGEFQPLYSTPI